MPSQSFADLGVSEPVVRALAGRGYTAPFAIQSLVIEDVLEGHDVLAKAPTGSGKTLAFAVPMADVLEADDRGPAALVLVPTRELALQVVEETATVAGARGLRVAPVYGGVGLDKQAKLARRAHIIVATPGRLEDLLARRLISLAEVEILVLDEADRMLDMGFKPAVDRIVAQVPRDRQTLFFSATLDGEAGRLAAAYTHNGRRHDAKPIVQKLAPVEHRFERVAHEDKLDHLVATLAGEERGLALVFVRTKRGADRLVKRLDRSGVSAAAMHGDKSQGQRERALARFEAGQVDTLVATDVAARGIDVEHITHVINFDPPADRDDYVHRVGRTGRAGRSGVGITFVNPEQARDVGRIARDLRLHAEFERGGFQPEPPAGRHPGTTSARPRSRRRR